MIHQKILMGILLLSLLPCSVHAQGFCGDKGDPGNDKPCLGGDCNGGGGTGGSIQVVVPKDPNEIIGPKGYDSLFKWVSVKDNLPYKILFENDPDFATAPAQKVIIYMPIHPKLNPNSLRIGDFGFGSFTFTVPPNTAVYTKRLDVRDSLGVLLDVTAGLDAANRRAFWVFESIDPATGLAATLPAGGGFLPVNDSTKGNGEGYVTLTIQPVSNAQTGDTVATQASIFFDTEDPLTTNTWSNIVDAVAPTSKMTSQPAYVTTGFPISWVAGDDSLGSGIKNYAVYYSKNYGPFTLLQENIDSTGMNFPGGDVGATYSFYSIATDNTGNRENSKNAGETITTVQSQPNNCPGNTITFTFGAPGSGYTLRWQADMGAGFQNLNNDTVFSGVTTNVLSLAHAPTSWYGYQFRCVATRNGNLIEGAAQVLKFLNTWLGTTSAAWEIPANWSCNTIPDENTDVIVSSNTPHPIQLSSNGTCRSLKLLNGAVFTVQAGYNLNITGK